MRRASALVLVVLLGFSGGAGQASQLELEYSFTGDEARDFFGEVVAGAGDVDGDAFPDVAVAAPSMDYVRIFSGYDGSVLHTLKGQSAGDGFGISVDGAGDVDYDGHDDVIVGAPYADYAQVFSGKDGSVLYTLTGSSGDNYGQSVAGVGDLDGDWHGDFAVGAPLAADASGSAFPGTVTVYSGTDASTLYTFYGDNDGDGLGTAVAGAGDVDADDMPDIVAGAAFARDAEGFYPGMARVYSGADGSTLLSTWGRTDGAEFGRSVDGAGDRDGDGFDDIVVGAPYDDGGPYTDSGCAMVVGSDGTVLLTEFGETDYVGFGNSVALLGDVDGDRLPEVAVGAPWGYDGGGVQTGYVRLYSGVDLSELATLYGTAEMDEYGRSVGAVGDCNDDHLADVLVGAPGDDTAAEDAGAAYVYLSPAPVGAISIESGATYANSASVTLSLTWTAGGAPVKEVRLRNAGADWSSWRSVEASLTWTLAGTDGTKTVEAQLRDEDNLLSAIVEDSIVLDRSKPSSCSITLEGGAAWAAGLAVDVALAGTDVGSGLSQVRLRNQGGSFSAWTDLAATVPWTLAAGQGDKTVEAEFRDRAGNVSDVVSDGIGVDLTAPVITVFTLNDGDPRTASRDCQAQVEASDSGGSGLSLVRFKASSAGEWGDWEPYAASCDFELLSGDGLKYVNAQVADAAGNESSFATDSILLDQTGPTVSGLVVNAGRLYVAPQQEVDIAVTAHDNAGGSGLAGVRATYDGGATFTEWMPWSTGAIAFPRTAASGDLAVQVVARDALGNESTLSPAAFVYFVEASPPFLGTGGSFSGRMSGHEDLDAVGLDLVSGDALSVKMKAAGADRDAPFPILFDLLRPDGTRILTGVTSVSGHVAAATGRHLLVVRLEGGQGPGQGSYSLSVSVKQAAVNAKGKSTVATEVVFSAAGGAAFKASLKGDGLDPASVKLTGPEGDVTATASGKMGSAKIAATLNRGTGSYRLRFVAAGPVSVSWSAKLARGPALVEP